MVDWDNSRFLYFFLESLDKIFLTIDHKCYIYFVWMNVPKIYQQSAGLPLSEHRSRKFEPKFLFVNKYSRSSSSSKAPQSNLRLTGLFVVNLDSSNLCEYSYFRYFIKKLDRSCLLDVATYCIPRVKFEWIDEHPKRENTKIPTVHI